MASGVHPARVARVEPGALVHEILDDHVDAAERGAVQRRLAEIVGRVRRRSRARRTSSPRRAPRAPVRPATRRPRPGSRSRRPAATISGVVPSAVGILASAPASASTLITSTIGVLGGEQERRGTEPVQPVALAVLHPVPAHAGVDVDAARDHLPDHMDAVERPGRHRPGRPEADVRPARAHRLVQRVPSGSGQIRIGALVEQEIGQLPVRVGRRHDQRATCRPTACR